jgi:hypothetical protein
MHPEPQQQAVNEREQGIDFAALIVQQDTAAADFLLESGRTDFDFVLMSRIHAILLPVDVVQRDLPLRPS